MASSSKLSSTQLLFSSGVTINAKLVVTADTIALEGAGGSNAVAITNLKTPAASSDAVTKAYVDSLVISGVTWKNAANVATVSGDMVASTYGSGTNTITWVGVPTIDGVTMVVNYRVVVKDNAATTGTNSMGIYDVTSITTNMVLTRSTDAASSIQANGSAIFVFAGTVNNDKSFVVTNDVSTTWGGGVIFSIMSSVPGIGGADTQVQYNNDGRLGGSSNFTFNNGTNKLTVTNESVSGTTDATSTISGALTVSGGIGCAKSIFCKLVKTEDGDVNAPGFSFISGTNTGIYYEATNVLKITNGGTNTFSLKTPASVIATCSIGNTPNNTTVDPNGVSLKVTGTYPQTGMEIVSNVTSVHNAMVFRNNGATGNVIGKIETNGVASSEALNLIGTKTINITSPYVSINGEFIPSLKIPLYSQNYGVRGDGSTNDTAALQAFFNACTTTGRMGYLQAGTFRCVSQVVINISTCLTTGCTIIGQGVQLSIISFDSGVAPPNLLVSSFPTGHVDCFYVTLQNFGIRGTVPNSVVFQLGVGVEGNANNEAINECVMTLNVSNYSGTNPVAVQIGYVLNSDLRFVANCGVNPGVAGTAMVLTAPKFCNFYGSYSAVGTTNGVGISFINLSISQFSYGNTFHSLDIENTSTCLIIDQDNAKHNTFIGGTWQYTSVGINAAKGDSNMIINPNVNGPLADFVNGGAGTASVGVGNLGIVLKSPKQYGITSQPPVKPTGDPTFNNTGQQYMVFVKTIANATIVYYEPGLSAVSLSTSNTFDMLTTFIVSSRGQIILYYNPPAPTWTWVLTGY